MEIGANNLWKGGPGVTAPALPSRIFPNRLIFDPQALIFRRATLKKLSQKPFSPPNVILSEDSSIFKYLDPSLTLRVTEKIGFETVS
jgi:hypothetical protein